MKEGNEKKKRNISSSRLNSIKLSPDSGKINLLFNVSIARNKNVSFSQRSPNERVKLNILKRRSELKVKSDSVPRAFKEKGGKPVKTGKSERAKALFSIFKIIQLSAPYVRFSFPLGGEYTGRDEKSVNATGWQRQKSPSAPLMTCFLSPPLNSREKKRQCTIPLQQWGDAFASPSPRVGI